MINNMDDAMFPVQEFALLPMVAAFGSDPFAGKNSSDSRRARAAKQRRDRYKRFAFMGGLYGFDFFDASGAVRTEIGEYIGPSKKAGYLQIRTTGSANLPAGIHDVKESNASQYIAQLTPQQLKDSGIEVGKDADGKAITARKASDIQTLADLGTREAPVGWTADDNGDFTTDDGKLTITKPSDENGNKWGLSRKGEPLSEHDKLADALKQVDNFDSGEGLSSQEAIDLENLFTQEAQLETEADGSGSEDAVSAEEALKDVTSDINTLLAKVVASKKGKTSKPQAKQKTAPVVTSDDPRKPTDGTRKKFWDTYLTPAVNKSLTALNALGKKRKDKTATAQDVQAALDAIDSAFSNENARGKDADVDSLRSLMEEYVQLPQTYAYLKGQADKLPDGEEKTAAVAKLAQFGTRNGELSTQIASLVSAIKTRSGNNDTYADAPTVDTSTNVPDVAEFEAPVYQKKAGKGRPKGTGKNQIAAKQAQKTPDTTPAPKAAEDGGDQQPAADETPAGPTPEERKAEAEAAKAEAEARKAEAEADKAEAEAPAPIEEAEPAPATAKAKKQGAVADAPETGTTKTGTRKRITNVRDLDTAPIGTVVHRFSGNGTFDENAFGTPGSDPLFGGEPSYLDSIVKAPDGTWRKVSPKTGNPAGPEIKRPTLRNDSTMGYMVLDTPDDGSTPETMYAQTAKGKADIQATRQAKADKTVEPVAELPATEDTKPAESPTPAADTTPAAPAQPKDMTQSEYVDLIENPFAETEQKAAAIVDKYDNEAGDLRALFDSGADGATLRTKLREISDAFVAEEAHQDDVDNRMKAGIRPTSADRNRASILNREVGVLNNLNADTPDVRAQLAETPSKEKDAYGKVIGEKMYGMELDALPTGARLKSIPHKRADGTLSYGNLTKQDDGTWTYDSDGVVATDIKKIADSNKIAYLGSPEPAATTEAPVETPAEEVTPDVTPAPAAPEVAPEATTTPTGVVELDLTGDIKAQIEKAIADGNDISFYYKGSGTEASLRVVSPDNVWTNPQTGQDNLYGLQEGEDKKKNFTISKMEGESQAETEPATGTSELEVDIATAPTTEAEVVEADAITPTADETAAEADANLDLITTRTTDEDYADEAYLPTEEQRNVIDAAVSELDVSVQALAGSGKTSTLVLAAKQLLKYHPDKKILYIAFNKTVQLEAEGRMPSENTEARTGDSLGWWGVDSSIRSKMGKGDALPKKIADHLGIPTSDKSREDIAHDLTKVIEKFSISESDDIGQEHFDAAEVEFNSKNLAYAQMYWADLNDKDGQIRLTNSHLTKMWALTNPDLGEMYGGNRNSFGKADVIFFDEAQDINPVMAKVIRDQTIQKIYVGDSNQAIYGFRGADDELDKVETDITLPMTRTFRFGQTLAGPGNRMLSLLKSKYKIIGAGKTDGTVVPTGSMTDANAVLTRTNGGRFSEIISELANGRVVGLTREDKADAERMLATVRWLKNGGTKPFPPHEDFDGYTTWKQVSNDVQRDKASGKVKTISNIFDSAVNPLKVSDVSAALGKVKVIADDDSQTPIDYSDGASGSFGPSVSYSVTDGGDGNLTMTINGQYRPMQKYISLLRPTAFRYDANTKSYSMTGTPAELKDTVDGIRGVPLSEVDVVVSTAHKAKGLEWKKVRIGDDFWGPEADDEGNLVFPEKQELNLAYVALTRAEEAIDPGSLSWIFDYTDDTDEDPTTASRGIPEGATQAGQPVAAPETAEEAPVEPETAPVVETPIEDVVEPVGTEENPVSPAEVPTPEETVAPAVETPTTEEVAPVDEGPADIPVEPAAKKTDAPLITNDDQSNLDPAPAEAVDTGVADVSSDPQDIADTYDNKDLKDALVTAVQNDEPGILIEGTNGDVAVVPVENVRDALQKQGTNTNDVIDEALGEPEAQDVPAEILSDENSEASDDQMKRFLLNHLMQTREAPDEHKDAIYQIATDEDATDEQLDWAVGILQDQPNLLDVKGADLPALPKNVVPAKITDPGQIIDAIERAYPSSTTMQSTGDLIVHSVDYQDKNSKTNFRYELGVVRTSNEMFYVYARETNLSTGETRSRRVSPFTHSARALNNDIIAARQEMLNTKGKKAKNLTLWFGKPNSKSDSMYIQEEGKIALEDGTSEPIHRREEPIHRDLVEAIKSALNKEGVTAQVVEAIYRDIARHGIGEAALREIQANFNVDDATFSRVIDTLNAHVSVQYKVRTYNIWVSDDNETPVDSGDLVDHTHEWNKKVRRGRVIRRQGTHWTKGYGYTDYLEFRPIIGYNADGSERLGKGSSVTSKNLTLLRTAQGTDGSERRAALADFVNMPVSAPATERPERKAPMEPAKPVETVAIDRSEPAKPTVTVAGKKKPAAANRNTSINQFTPTDVDASQMQVGDFFMTMDPELGLPRLAEVISTEFDDQAGTFKVTAIVPDSADSAQAFEQEWDVNPDDGLSGQRMIAFRKPATEPEKASDESIQNLLLTIRSHDTSFLSAEDDAAIKDFVTRFVSGEDFTQDEVDALVNKITESPNRISTPTSAETAVEVAEAIVEDTKDNADTNALQNVVDEATLKISELDEAGVTEGPNVLTGFTIKQNANGVYYPEGGIKKGSKLYKAIRRGEVIPPNFPFITSDTDWGGVMYFDSNGERHWGQFGAAGAVLRVKDANGDYKYLLARRAKGMSTGGGKWSVPGGAHDDIADKKTPVVTSARELYEELGIDPTGMTVAGGAKKTVAPDWEYNYSIIDTPDETITDGIDLKKNAEISELGWFTADEIRALQANDEMHGDVDTQTLDDIFAVGDAPTTDPLIIDDTIFTPDEEPDGFVDLTGFTQTGGQGGSNPGGTFQGPDGKKYYAKFQQDEMHAANEVAAAKLYNAAGVGAVDVNHGALEGKDNVTQSPVIYVDRNKSPQSDSALRKKTQEGFAIDAWLANWDGALNDNTLADTNGDPIRMDVGGALLFRAQGGAKGAQFGDTATEIDSLRDPSINATAAAIYGSMTDAEITESAKKLLNISEADIDNIVDDAFGMTDSANKIDVDNLKATLKARRLDILNRFGLSETDSPEPTEPTVDEVTPDATPEVTDVTPTVEESTSEPAASTPVANAAPEATYDPSTPASMDRNFNAIMTNFNVIKDAQEGDNIRVEYGYVDENGKNQMRIIGVRKTNGVWKSSKDSDAKEVIFDTDNGVYTLTDDELIAKLDALGSDKSESSKVLRFGSRAMSDGTELTPQMIKYGYVDDDTDTDARTSKNISTSMYGESADIVLNMTYQPDGLAFVGVSANGDKIEYSIAEIQARSAAGEVFKIGTPRGAVALGSKATPEWIDSPKQGDQIFVNLDYSNASPSALIGETFTANENGEWVSSYTGKPVSPEDLKLRDDLKVGNSRKAFTTSTGTKEDDLFSFETTLKGAVKNPSEASRILVDGVAYGAIITDGTTKYKFVRTSSSNGFENLTTGEVLTKLGMRKVWDANQNGFKFDSGLDGLNSGDAVTDPTAAAQPTVGAIFLRDKSFQLPFAKFAKSQKEFYVFTGSYWTASDGSGSTVGVDTMRGYINKGEITLQGRDDLNRTPAVATESGEPVAVDTTPVTAEETAALTASLSGMDNNLSKLFTPTLASNMDGQQTRGLLDFIENNVDENGSISDVAVAEAYIRFHPTQRALPTSKEGMLEIIGQLDNQDFKTHGGRTFKEVFDDFEAAMARSEHRVNNYEDAHPLGELGRDSNKIMELLNTLFPELSDHPEIVGTRQELEDYQSPSEIIYRGVKTVYKKDKRGNYVRDDNGNYVELASPRELHRAYREEDGLWWGYGVYGQGQYFAENRSTSQGSYTDVGSDGVAVAKIKTGANIFSTVNEYDDKITWLTNYSNQLLYAFLISQGYTPGTTLFTQKMSEYDSALLGDAGGRAGFFGYDALYVENNKYYVLLNRTATVMYDGVASDWDKEGRN